MSASLSSTPVYSDLAGLDALKNGVGKNDPAAIRAVARQFESLFARMMIQSMRDAVGTDPIFGSDQPKTYQSMFDDQLSLELTKGRGLGLADMLIRQLQRVGAAPAGAVDPGASAGTAAPASGAAAIPTASASPVASAATQATFVQELWPQAQQAAQQLGVDPRGLVAQAALETDWGQRVPHTRTGQSSNNLFGVKATADWTGGRVTAGTQEVEGGSAVATSAVFRAYGTRAQSLEDYVALLRTNPRYAAALNTGSNVNAFASALQQGGYATDPDYARKVGAIAASLKSADALPTQGGTGTL
jgi:flagellar protein FlgJ